jgi:hypothetical protein
MKGSELNCNKHSQSTRGSYTSFYMHNSQTTTSLQRREGKANAWEKCSALSTVLFIQQNNGHQFARI